MRCTPHDRIRTDQAIRQLEAGENPRFELFPFARSFKNKGCNAFSLGFLLDNFELLPDFGLFLAAVGFLIFLGLELCDPALERILALIPEFFNPL
jgi:hypothetical protein